MSLSDLGRINQFPGLIELLSEKGVGCRPRHHQINLKATHGISASPISVRID
jgi:hypothetical protein